MTTLIQRLTLMHDTAGAKEVQSLLDELASVGMKANMLANETLRLRKALRDVLEAENPEVRRLAETSAQELLAAPFNRANGAPPSLIK